jgi:putative tryptophan/tyrosine transport system substrate-binding protein
MIGRRAFITLLGGVAAWPLAAGAALASEASGQRGDSKVPPAMPVIGFLASESQDGYTDRLRGYRQGLKDSGYTEGENVAIEYGWANGHIDRLPGLAAELVRRRVAVIAALGSANTAVAAKATTTTTPIVFLVGEDPVRLGLVASVARPGGNLTGINLFNSELISKRLELLRMLIPSAARVAVLVNPADRANAETTLRDLHPAARTMGLQVQAFEASTSGEIDAAFASIARAQPDALFVAGQTYFNSRRFQLVHSASYYRLPATYGSRSYPDIGGLMSYGADVIDAYRQAGVHTGRILKGAKAADLPVVQPSKFQLVINAQAARILSVALPPSLLSIADEVIE